MADTPIPDDNNEVEEVPPDEVDDEVEEVPSYEDEVNKIPCTVTPENSMALVTASHVPYEDKAIEIPHSVILQNTMAPITASRMPYEAKVIEIPRSVTPQNTMALITASRMPYDPTHLHETGPLRRKLLERGQEYQIGSDWYETVRLTARGNQALRELCHTEDQRTVWRFPSYPFVIRKGSVSVAQLATGRPSYVNAVLIASRGVIQQVPCQQNSQSVFFDEVRIPGYWNGACAGCKWPDHGSKCSYATRGEQKFVPTSLASLPRGAIEELED